ncbi:hypothetical protein K432DRAFT_419049 [Lepidopterella palustris CBS 459.81]|uniref:Zn(2)-C6 fungal-type domain-containing protein n=1 Tax=Lepidopterella palustris CBS 459.81 TaxID=1314670 RepID=A0A8E2E3T8_9PEZI|nr:hypothetical protein K432DRAFT_419049 [Lepidopterella palustris CBS 459.81]
MASTSFRRRLACTECTRRKVKCDKEIPCNNCIKKGIQNACTRDTESTPTFTHASVAPTTLPDVQHETGVVLEVLLKRVSELEARLKPGSGVSRNDIPSTSTPPLTLSSTTPATIPHSETDSEIEDAATILEFLAWGRMKNPDYHSKESAIPDLQMLQLNLPTRHQVSLLFDWHIKCLLWYHGSFHAPIFRRQLQEFYDRHNGAIESKSLSLQWVALLFSILTGAMTCAGDVARTWGFRDTEQATLANRWFRGTITCLHHSVEAIATLTISAHLLGFSNQQSVLLASAVKISQSLGLHRLGSESLGRPSERDLRGLRAWSQLCNRHDEDLILHPESEPTTISYARYLLDIAFIMPQLQDAVMASNTLYTKYEQDLKYDKQMRALATVHRPRFLSNTPIDPTWPLYVPWARQALAISSAHKNCMIHRSFLDLSFTNTAFSFTRRTCIAAAKTILKEQKHAARESGPILWIYHAFSVAACIILCLDVFHRTPTEPESPEHRALVEESISMLSYSTKSAVARRGERLLTELLEAIDRSRTDPRRKRRVDEANSADTSMPTRKRQRFLDMPAFVKSCYDATNVFFREEMFANLLTPHVPFDGMSAFENLLFLARGYDE